MNFDFADRESLIAEIERLRSEVSRLEAEADGRHHDDDSWVEGDDEPGHFGPPKPVSPSAADVLTEAGFVAAGAFARDYRRGFGTSQADEFNVAADYLEEAEATLGRDFGPAVARLRNAVRIALKPAAPEPRPIVRRTPLTAVWEFDPAID